MARITERGRRLAEYDVAAWYASDAVVALKPAAGSVTRYIARKNGDLWIVAFGRLNEKRDKFLIAYEATQGTHAKEFGVKKFETPKEDTGFFLSAAKAIDTSLAEFKARSQTLQCCGTAGSLESSVCVRCPAQTEAGTFLLGGDVRYLVSADGSRLSKSGSYIFPSLSSRRLQEEKVEAGFHIAVLDDIPEDTDVFHVMSRKPSVPEWVATNQFVFRIEPDGTINYVMTREAFMKMKDK